MKTKDLYEYTFNIKAYQVLSTDTGVPLHLIDDMVRTVMNFYHDTNTNENIKNPSFIMSCNSLIALGLLVKTK